MKVSKKVIKKQYPKEVLKTIPKGPYCHGTIGRDPVCLFWFHIKGRPKQENGYCALLGKGDYELNREPHISIVTSYIEGKAQKPIKIKYDAKHPDWSSLLWDQCKECGLNMGSA